MPRSVFTILLLLLVAGTALSRTNIIIPVYVDQSGDDYIGRQISFKVIEKLNQSAVYTALDTAYNKDLGFFRILITSVATSQANDWSAMSIVYTLDLPDSPFGIYLNSAVYFRNVENLSDLADKIILNMDRAINNYSTWRKEKDKTLRVD